MVTGVTCANCSRKTFYVEHPKKNADISVSEGKEEETRGLKCKSATSYQHFLNDGPFVQRIYETSIVLFVALCLYQCAEKKKNNQTLTAVNTQTLCSLSQV